MLEHKNFGDHEFAGVVCVSKSDSTLSWQSVFPNGTPSNEIVDSLSLFPVASITKTFTASVVLALVRNGLLELDTPICKYLPEMNSACSSGVTVSNLLNHTSGLDISEGGRLAWQFHADRPPDFVAMFSILESVYPPCSVFHYSSVNYNLLGAMSERVSGLTLEELYRKYVFAPANMLRSGLTTSDSMLRCFPRFFGGERPTNPNEGYGFVSPSAGGAAYSTIIDLRSFLVKLKTSSYAEQVTPNLLSRTMLAQNAPGHDSEYGFGMIHSVISSPESNSKKGFVYHTGRIAGYCCFMGMIPEDSIEILFFSNTTLPKATIDSVVKNELLALGYHDLPSLDFDYEIVIQERAYLYN